MLCHVQHFLVQKALGYIWGGGGGGDKFSHLFLVCLVA